MAPGACHLLPRVAGRQARGLQLPPCSRSQPVAAAMLMVQRVGLQPFPQMLEVSKHSLHLSGGAVRLEARRQHAAGG
jgi:hypothetical protein